MCASLFEVCHRHPVQPAYIRDTANYVFKIETDDTVDTAGPFLTVRWGQNHPYNAHCPNGYTGCVATAIAQIMTYHCYPSSISLTYDGVAKSSQDLDWEVMKRHDRTGSCRSDCTGHEMIGQLIREIGQQVKMRYKTGSSGAYSEDVPSCLSRLGYSSGSLSNYDFKNVIVSLRKKRPVYVSGLESQGGHAWVADGFRIETNITRTWKSIPGTDMWILDREEKEIHNYIHYNWGWDGHNNGYFCSSVFDVSTPHELDDGCFNTQTGNYASKVHMITNISPNL